MKLNRTISLILSLIMVFCMLAGCSDVQQDNTEEPSTTPQEALPVEPTVEELIDEMGIPDLWKQELLHSEQLGLPIEKVQQETISGAEMMELLDCFVEYAAPERTVQWQQFCPKLRSSQAALRRTDAMAALFLAADMVGGDYYGHNLDIWHFAQSINHNWDAEESWLTGELFGEAGGKSDYNGGSFGACSLDAAGFYYNASRPSNFSGETPFAFDKESNSFTLASPLTYAEGLLAVVRLISSANPNLFPYEETAVDEVYLDAADDRREEIRINATELPTEVTGNNYYISNNGSDDNDGRSPETAWATPYRAMTAGLRYGDAVLFERGGTWYIDVETNLGDTSRNHGYADGVHVGAYGDGEKPVLRGDIERANEAAFWELYYEKEGIKIWKASESLRDSAVIVFNEGDAWAEEVLPWLDDTGTYINPDGSPFVVEEALNKNLTFCNLLTFDESFFNRTDSYARGDLYLRCDAGNPAEVYETVSVPQEPVGIDMFPNSSIRDISVLYCTMMGTQVTDIGTTPGNYQFINLEIGWCGGWVQDYSLQEMGGVCYGYKPHIAGGGIGIYQTETQVKNSYIHHCGPMAMIESMHDHIADDGKIVHHQNLIFTGNLYEYCGAPMHWTDLSFMEVPGSTGLISNLIFEDNLVMFSGDGWIYNSVLQSDGGSGNSLWLSAVENGMGAANNEGIYIKDNLFYISRYAMITLLDYLALVGMTPVNAQPIFSGNTYVQFAARPLLQKNWSTEIYYPSEEVVRDILGDETGTLIILGKE